MEKFDATCRTCNTEKSKLISLSSITPANPALSLRDVLSTVCPGICSQDDDGLPQNICYFCSKQLEIAYKFQLQYTKAHDDLVQIVVAASLKRDPEPNDDKEDRSCLKEEFEESLTVLDENLEFLEEDVYMEDNGEEEELAERIPEAEESLALKSTSTAESEAPIICCHCDKKFFTVNGLQFHEKLAHKNLQPILTNAEILTIVCKYCPQAFETKNELMLHCRNEHRLQLAQDLTCDICQKTFTGKNRYEHHLLYHRKERFQCTVKSCTRNFLIKYKLTDHLKRFHGITLTLRQMRDIKPRIIEESFL